MKSAGTGKIGDGKIFVTEIEQTLQIIPERLITPHCNPIVV